MTLTQLKKLLQQCPNATADYPFGPEARVYKVMGKMFALLAEQETPPRVTLKAKPADVQALIDSFEAIVPGYYMNKQHWFTLTLNGEVSEDMLRDLIEASYALVVSKLTKAQQAQLQQQNT
ncbi:MULTISPECIES: MmcQ/YjbR family DNA-binding protein [Shewanella]|uniref:MmcQ/YjbR family DNA-binding protein n=1 Tax=Shewanella algae TaxID=38313 RepID=A0AAD1KB12_9GAMM|nr:MULTISPECIES: MmcQ/YjbR family DNA-binding protein [Shewanella]EKT4486922.1 MmcQ/YjbR family DNA-binding protein [Shewanella algae]MBC8797146.1 MmcQ/YjbR family DNA-binding protein [Shewanella algae]MBO2547447.1 MmcQ/YjbR family DNA-binding protein [Shewanella algae]MBO2556313.1 MmcQ/YjbR family DNA-binding protein [Shewanella algae]MBO2564851.1 MmcQ/YjbR family DNA-binding protein [Shewanella algae]